MRCKRLCRATSKSSLKSLKGYINTRLRLFDQGRAKHGKPDLDSLATVSQSFSISFHNVSKSLQISSSIVYINTSTEERFNIPLFEIHRL